MKALFLILLSGALLCTEAAVASRHPKAPGKRAFAHSNDAKGRNAHMQFRHAARPAPLLDLKAHNPDRFKTVRSGGHYKYK